MRARKAGPVAESGPSSRLLDALGLARRAGRLAVGTRAVRETAAAGDLELLVVAGDAGDNALGRLGPAREASGRPTVRAVDREALGAALGRGPVVAVGITDRGLAEEVERLADRPASDRDRTPGGDGPYEGTVRAGRRDDGPEAPGDDEVETKSIHAS